MEFLVSRLKSRVWGDDFKVEGVVCRVWGLGSRVQDFAVEGSGFKF